MDNGMFENVQDIPQNQKNYDKSHEKLGDDINSRRDKL